VSECTHSLAHPSTAAILNPEQPPLTSIVRESLEVSKTPPQLIPSMRELHVSSPQPVVSMGPSLSAHSPQESIPAIPILKWPPAKPGTAEVREVSTTPPSGLPSRQEITSSPHRPDAATASCAPSFTAQAVLIQPVPHETSPVTIHEDTPNQSEPQQSSVKCAEADSGEIPLSLGQESCSSRHTHTIVCKVSREPERAQNKGVGEQRLSSPGQGTQPPILSNASSICRVSPSTRKDLRTDVVRQPNSVMVAAPITFNTTPIHLPQKPSVHPTWNAVMPSHTLASPSAKTFGTDLNKRPSSTVVVDKGEETSPHIDSPCPKAALALPNLSSACLSHPVTNPLPRTHASRMFDVSSLVTPHVDKGTLYPTSCQTHVL
jgi:hypothetical protein